jgi:dipeptidyl-peptidase-4
MQRARIRRAQYFLVCVATMVAGLATPGLGQAPPPPRSLSIDLIYDPSSRVNFSGRVGPDPAWIDGRSFARPGRTAKGTEWQRLDATTGEAAPLFDLERMRAAVTGLTGIDRDDAENAVLGGGYVLNAMRTGAWLTIADDLYHYDIPTGTARRLTSTPGAEEEASFSPDGRLVAFVRSHNLYTVDVTSGRERALTRDGSPTILNGLLDWLYQEEIYGRGNFRGYWWSPDSSRLAFLQLDERQVPAYTVTDHIPYRPALEVTPYPKAGDPNPRVRLGVARSTGGSPSWVALEKTANEEILVVNVGWTPDSRQVVHQVQNREQTWLDLRITTGSSGTPRTVLRETTPAWVNENGNPVWMRDGSFLWISERSGFRHLYHYRPDGSLVRQVTNGTWDVRSVYGVDEARGSILVAATERSSIGVDVYRVGLAAHSITRLSQATGTHRALFDPTFSRYVDVWSNATTPAQMRLHDGLDGRELRVLERNDVPALTQFTLATPEFLQVPARDGFVMEAMMIKPPDFSPSRRYPVYQFTYAGPGAARVRDRWGGTDYLFYQLLAQKGVIVWVLDNRSASGKGAVSQWPVWGRLGELELQDLEDGVAWLRRQPYIDPARLVLSGWSYGGFMTAYALTHSTSWAAGVVGAPVTDWRDYDSIYTERLMKLPRNNVDGYKRTAPRFAADRLRGRLLLIHGTMDDNVHMQNSVQFAYELQRAGKPFELMTYAKSRHAFEDPLLTKHLQQLILDFVLRSVGLARPSIDAVE